MQVFGGVAVQVHPLLTLALYARVWSALRPLLFNPWQPMNRRLGGPHTKSGHFGEIINLLALLGFEPRVVQPAT